MWSPLPAQNRAIRKLALSRCNGALLERQERKRLGEQPATEKPKGARFSARGVKVHRERLGLSAKNYGQLVGVAGLTIYSWESGKSKPREKQLAALVAVRGLGKREALKGLEMVGG